MDILCIPPSQLDDYWPYVWPHLSRGVEVAGRERAELASDIIYDRARVWIATGDQPRAVHSAWFTELLSVDGRRVLMVFGLGGVEPKKWIGSLNEAMATHARAEGCKAVRFVGRDGWARLLPQYEVTGTVADERIYERAIQ